MINVTSTPTSVTIRDTKTLTSVTARIASGLIEFHQTINGNDGKAAAQVQKKVTEIVKGGMDKKLAYKDRFNKMKNIMSVFVSYLSSV